MGLNYRTEQRKFDKEWQRLRVEYRDAGMSEESINELYEFDLNCFNSRRNAERWNQNISSDSKDLIDDESPLFYKFIEKLSYTDSYHLESDRYAWIDQIEDDRLYGLLLQLDTKDKELLTLAAFENYSRNEIGRMYGVTGQAIGQRLKRLGQKLYHV